MFPLALGQETTVDCGVAKYCVAGLPNIEEVLLQKCH